MAKNNNRQSNRLDDFNEEFRSFMSSSSGIVNDLINLREQGVPQPKGALSPDKFGAECIFTEDFLTGEMEDDFPLIARDFYAHEYAGLSQYETVEYANYDCGSYWPSMVTAQFTLSLMLNAVKGGSSYTKELFLCLYRTYYKKEYKYLKRFNTINSEDLLVLAKPEEETPSYVMNLARILCIAPMMGITIHQSCNYIYAFLNDYYAEKMSRLRYDFSEIAGEFYQKCRQEIEEQYDLKKLYSLDDKASKFLGNALQWLGYSPTFIECCDDNFGDIAYLYAVALAVFKKTYPKREYTIEEISVYAVMLRCVGAVSTNMDWLSEYLRIMAFGINGTDFYDEYPSAFQPENVRFHNESGLKTEKKHDNAEVTPAVPAVSKTDGEIYVAEIEKLRLKVHQLESENGDLRARLSDHQRTADKERNVREQLESANRELAALRDYVYSLTEEDLTENTVSLADMKMTLVKMNVVIIGGHSNWVSKLRNEFPDWTYVNPEVSGSTDASIVDKADYVYFFTDTISHPRYYQFIRILREHKVNFGYIHGVNIEKNIQSIYRDMC